VVSPVPSSKRRSKKCGWQKRVIPECLRREIEGLASMRFEMVTAVVGAVEGEGDVAGDVVEGGMTKIATTEVDATVAGVREAVGLSAAA